MVVFARNTSGYEFFFSSFSIAIAIRLTGSSGLVVEFDKFWSTWDPIVTFGFWELCLWS